MKIAYFTTAQDNEEFKIFALDRKLGLNSSNQVFHSNFVECLALNNEVDVYSARIDSLKNNKAFVKQLGQINWHYLATKKNKASNFRVQLSQIKKADKNVSIAFVDTMNQRCMMYAKEFCSKRKIPLIGIVTDNPNNITGLTPSEIKNFLKLGAKCDGFICLSEELNALYNPSGKPHLLIKGLCRDVKKTVRSPASFHYFFYAGTLLKQYGIYDLINAFSELKMLNAKLVIAGHHAEPDFEELVKKNSKIVYLGNIDNDTVLNYENHSIANINPRPYDEQIDKYSIPSKVIEYSSKNSLIISTISTSLKRDLRESVLWVDKKYTLKQRLFQASEMEPKSKALLIKGTNGVYTSNYSLEANNRKIAKFLTKFVK